MESPDSRALRLRALRSSSFGNIESFKRGDSNTSMSDTEALMMHKSASPSTVSSPPSASATANTSTEGMRRQGSAVSTDSGVTGSSVSLLEARSPRSSVESLDEALSASRATKSTLNHLDGLPAAVRSSAARSSSPCRSMSPHRSMSPNRGSLGAVRGSLASPRSSRCSETPVAENERGLQVVTPTFCITTSSPPVSTDSSPTGAALTSSPSACRSLPFSKDTTNDAPTETAASDLSGELRDSATSPVPPSSPIPAGRLRLMTGRARSSSAPPLLEQIKEDADAEEAAEAPSAAASPPHIAVVESHIIISTASPPSPGSSRPSSASISVVPASPESLRLGAQTSPNRKRCSTLATSYVLDGSNQLRKSSGL